MVRELSPRQAQVLCLLELGHTYDDVAEELGISASTVRSQLSRVRAKFGVGPGSVPEILSAIRTELQREMVSND